MDTKNRIREFIFTNFYVTDAVEIGDDTSLIDSGIVDSTGVLELISFLEQEFGIRVTNADILPENLDSIERVAAFTARKSAMVSSGASPP